MTKPSNFIVHTGYASLKNDGNTTAQLVIANGTTIPSGGRELSTIVTLGSKGGSLRTRMKRSTDSYWRPAANVSLLVSINYPGDGTYQEYTSVNVRRISATQVKVYCILQNFSPGTTSVVGTTTIDVKISTFLSPFTT